MSPSVYTDDRATWVCFGAGAIAMGVADDKDQVAVWLGDTLKENKIGVEFSTTQWNQDVPGRNVVLGFNKVESIDVLMETLMVARKKLVEHGPGRS